MKKIFIDAGHNYSGWNTGAVGNGMREQDITFEVARDLGIILRQAGFETMLSRPTLQTNLGHDNNSAINARWQMSNAWGADYFISIHANAAGGTGAESFYWDVTAEEFSRTVLDTFCREMGLRNRRNVLTSQWGVIRQTNCPAILFELAFIDSPLSNPDVEILRNRRWDMAAALAKGFFKYFGVTLRSNGEGDAIERDGNIRFNSIEELPEWAKPTITGLVRSGYLRGDGGGLDLSMDMARILVVLDRAKVFEKRSVTN
ncbi:MAG: N-acetylmuramoyl-L-alanine amidase [Clostridiales bacterium]|jgi:N-acetylmuramoyl-L-alanine amidase|nr:N-acetylmuramoyl-L-alanine amidase [Clostridiales bacterium]